MKKIGFYLLFIALLSSFSVLKRIDVLIEKEIKTVFNIEAYSKKPIQISEEITNELSVKLTNNNFFEIFDASNNKLGYYYFGKAFGKAAYFDFIVVFDKDLVVSKIKILAYREDHGGEIASKRWLRQFIGSEKDKTLKYKKDIAAISGATLSALSLTTEVNKLLKSVGVLYNKKLI